jgi:Tfp pilus assembly protein PilZ
MLQMKCPECDGIISSSLLVELGSITCSQCKENVIVKDVFVTTEAFTMYRDTLLDRIRHYRTLLKEIEREKISLGKSDVSSTAAQKSLNQNYAALRELLEASRGNYRLKISQELPLDLEWEGNVTNGRLLNLCTKGASIKPKRLHGFPQKGSEVKLRLALPDDAEPLSIAAKIAWIDKNKNDEEQNSITMGVSFINLNEKTRACIWDYILAHTGATDNLENSNSILSISQNKPILE